MPCYNLQEIVNKVYETYKVEVRNLEMSFNRALFNSVCMDSVDTTSVSFRIPECVLVLDKDRGNQIINIFRLQVETKWGPANRFKIFTKTVNISIDDNPELVDEQWITINLNNNKDQYNA